MFLLHLFFFTLLPFQSISTDPSTFCFISLFNIEDEAALLLRKAYSRSMLIAGSKTWIYHDLSRDFTQPIEWEYSGKTCYTPSYPPAVYDENEDTSKLFFLNIKDLLILDLQSLGFGGTIDGTNPIIIQYTVYKSQLFYIKKDGEEYYLVERQPSSYDEMQYTNSSFSLAEDSKIALIRLSTFGNSVLFLLEINENEYKCYLLEMPLEPSEPSFLSEILFP